MRKAALVCGGVFNLVCALFHLSFWRQFHWHEELPRLSPINGAIVQVENVVLIYLLLAFGVISLWLARRTQTAFGFGEKAFLCLVSGFYTCRALAEIPFFGWSPRGAVVCGLCLAIVGACLVPLRAHTHCAVDTNPF